MTDPTPNPDHSPLTTHHSPLKLWGGRFAASTDEIVERLNNSLTFDVRLWWHDIAGSIAHATMLGETGIIAAAEVAAIVQGLQEIEQGIAAGTLQFDPSAEDIHTAVELLLRERIGPVAGKLHTARSRNDQVATDTRLYLRDAIDEIEAALKSLQKTLTVLAEREMEIILPGYTHLQHAQPVLLAHHLLAYFWMFQRDRERLADARKRVNILPLGAGALAGTTFPIDPFRVATLLKFDSVADNSLDAVSDRDYIIEFLSSAALIMTHLSRLAEEIILWNSPEFSFVELDDSVTTGSSIMPQKKNPDVAELTRGKTGRVYGHLMAMLTVMKGLPLAYNKDMQEDKEPLFDTVDTLLLVIPAFQKVLATAKFRRERMAAALRGDFSTATDLADLLVRHGIPFREAHQVVGRIVLYCIEQGLALEELDAKTLKNFAPELPDGFSQAITVEASIAARRTWGGTAPEAVREQLARAKERLST